MQDLNDDSLRNTARAVEVNEIYKLSEQGAFDPERYRMHAKVSNYNRSKSTRGLIDTGANTEALSAQACWDLGIADQIEKCDASVKVADSRSIRPIGKVKTTIHVGDVPYTNTFLVMNEIDGYGMVIGTRFLRSSQLMNKVYGIMQGALGPDNVAKGN